jgi:hypothetical protein
LDILFSGWLKDEGMRKVMITIHACILYTLTNPGFNDYKNDNIDTLYVALFTRAARIGCPPYLRISEKRVYGCTAESAHGKILLLK